MKRPISRAVIATALIALMGLPVLARAEPTVPTPQTAFDTWAAYRSRWNAIQTVTVYTTDSVEMLRPAADPLEAPKAIILEGKIDRDGARSKANLLMDFGSVQSGMQLKASADSPHTLQRPVMIVEGEWIPLERDRPTTTTESPETLLLDMLFLPDPNVEWDRVEGVEEDLLDIEELGAIPVTFVKYRRGDGTLEISISLDGRAVGGMRVFDKAGRLRTLGRVLLWTRHPPIGFVPRAVTFRQFDEEGRPYRDLRGIIAARLNETGFDYLFD